MVLQLFVCLIFMSNFAQTSANLIKFGDYSFKIRDSSQLVEIYTSMRLKQLLLGSIKSLQKNESLEDLQVIQNSCPNYIKLLQVPVAKNYYTISLIIVMNSSSESTIHICRMENEIRLASFTQESNLKRLKLYLDVLETICTNKRYRKPLKTQILVISSKFDVLQIKFQDAQYEEIIECRSNCLECLNNTTCDACNLGFYLDYFGNCKQCDDSCKICDSSEKCTSSISNAIQTRELVTCVCTTISCYRKLDNKDICEGSCDSSFCKFCDDHIDDANYVGYFENNVKSGRGILKWRNGQKYDGHFENDSMSGKGTFYYPNGEKYVGNWENGFINGEGVLYASNGTVSYNGLWKK